MSALDWIVLFGTLITIAGYGVYKTYKVNDMDGYIRGSGDMNWWTIGLSIMATQASAITFLSTPGQAYEDGMRFIQFYFGLPLAMIILSVTFLPIYYKLKPKCSKKNWIIYKLFSNIISLNNTNNF